MSEILNVFFNLRGSKMSECRIVGNLQGISNIKGLKIVGMSEMSEILMVFSTSRLRIVGTVGNVGNPQSFFQLEGLKNMILKKP